MFRPVAQSPQWHRGKFVNQLPTEAGSLRSLGEVAPRYLARPKGAGKPGGQIPVLPYLPGAAKAADVQITWLGHAAFVVELEGLRFLLDPMLGRRPSPVRFAGPARLHPAPVEPHQLSGCDAVILSHDHYDHLDAFTIRTLAGFDTRFICPIGVGPVLARLGVGPAKITELDWHEHTQVGHIRVDCLPARHFSGRSLIGRERTLWASYGLTGQQRIVYFGGDTGVQREGWGQIRRALGPIDYAIMPIGAYDPAWHDIHCDAMEAVAGFELLGAQTMIPCHWATFDLALHGWAHPALVLAAEAEARPISVLWPQVGETVTDAHRPVGQWWRPLVTDVNRGKG